MASPGIGPNGPHEQKESQSVHPEHAGVPVKNPAKEFADEIGPDGPHALEATQDSQIGPNGPHNP